jgi:hypothetical protein
MTGGRLSGAIGGKVRGFLGFFGSTLVIRGGDGAGATALACSFTQV